jgi:hypothetical protein
MHIHESAQAGEVLMADPQLMKCKIYTGLTLPNQRLNSPENAVAVRLKLGGG